MHDTIFSIDTGYHGISHTNRQFKILVQVPFVTSFLGSCFHSGLVPCQLYQWLLLPGKIEITKMMFQKDVCDTKDHLGWTPEKFYSRWQSCTFLALILFPSFYLIVVTDQQNLFKNINWNILLHASDLSFLVPWIYQKCVCIP